MLDDTIASLYCKLHVAIIICNNRETLKNSYLGKVSFLSEKKPI